MLSATGDVRRGGAAVVARPEGQRRLLSDSDVEQFRPTPVTFTGAMSGGALDASYCSAPGKMQSDELSMLHHKLPQSSAVATFFNVTKVHGAPRHTCACAWADMCRHAAAALTVIVSVHSACVTSLMA